jgi:AcrR family transcriptional regulator
MTLTDSPQLKAVADTSLRQTRTRRSLLEAGLTLFAKRPVDAVSIDEIVATAGVSKGSFFNHFADKSAFAASLATEIRLEVERLVTLANETNTDPVRRLARGMRVAAAFAVEHRSQSLVLLRSSWDVSEADHPLNAGLMSDLSDLIAAGIAVPEATRQGMSYWISLCQSVIMTISHTPLAEDKAAETLEGMLILGLGGLGVNRETALTVARDEVAVFLNPVTNSPTA